MLFDLFCETNYTKISFFTKCFSRKIPLNFQQIARVCIKAFQLTISSRIVKKLAILLILLRNSANFKNSPIVYFAQYLKCIFVSAVIMPTKLPVKYRKKYLHFVVPGILYKVCIPLVTFYKCFGSACVFYDPDPAF